MTSTITDIELIEFLDFEPDIACEVETPSVCDKEAEWRMVKACCGFVHLRCTEHKNRALRAYDTFSRLGGGRMQCTRCNTNCRHPTGYTIVEPIS